MLLSDAGILNNYAVFYHAINLYFSDSLQYQSCPSSRNYDNAKSFHTANFNEVKNKYFGRIQEMILSN